MTAAPPLIAFAHVGKSFDGGRVRAVDDLSIEVAEGEFLAIVGGSGSGKTTLLRLANRLIDADEGHITVEGEDVRAVDPVQLRRRIGYVFQSGGRLLAQGTLTELSDSDDAYVGELLRTPRRQAERLNVLLPRDGAA